jgi:heme/copper-type cytochrome/quinol oxidase subunit 4
MAIYNLHRVLILATVAFAAGLGYFALHHLRTQAENRGSYIAMLIGAAVMALVMLGYFFYFNAHLRRQRLRGEIQ